MLKNHFIGLGKVGTNTETRDLKQAEVKWVISGSIGILLQSLLDLDKPRHHQFAPKHFFYQNHMEMFRNNSNAPTPFFDNEHLNFHCPLDARDQLKLCTTSSQKASLDQNSVSTGLRLSCDEHQRNLVISSACGSMVAESSVFSSSNVGLERELSRHKEEFEYYMKNQEQNLLKGLKDIRQRQFAEFLVALEGNLVQKLQDKNLELETISLKNKELVDRTKQLTAESHKWCNMAKYNESIVNVLKTSLQQAMQNVDAEIGDATSCIDPNNSLGFSGQYERSISVKKLMICRFCESKDACVLLMPCRHLCLCKECEGSISSCPVCRKTTTSSFEVYLR